MRELLHGVVLQGVLRLLMWGGRMLLMGHACTADEGCVCQCSLGVYMTMLQIMIVLISWHCILVL